MDDTAATAIMQRFGKAYFKKDRALVLSRSAAPPGAKGTVIRIGFDG